MNTILAGGQYLAQGKSSVWQLEPSDSAFLASRAVAEHGHTMTTLLTIALICTLLAIWWKPLKKLFIAGIAAAMLLLSPGSAEAYYSKTNYSEWMPILPNQSAFIVPLAGDNLSSQGQFNAKQYSDAKRVPTKMVEIHHAQLPGSSWISNYWVPAENLLIVNRIPYNREWNASPTKGTSSKDEGFECESAESINVRTAIVIAAKIKDEDAATYLATFGVISPFNRPISSEGMSEDDGKLIFASTLYAKDLASIMDGVVRGKVHTEICNEMGSRSLLDLIAQKTQIISTVEKKVTDFYKTQGITIDYVGWAAPLDYDQKIQASINNVFIAGRNAQASLAIRDSLPILDTQANIEIKQGLASGLATHGLPQMPSYLFLPNSFIDWVSSWFTAGAKK
jgi:hypothetical protein